MAWYQARETRSNFISDASNVAIVCRSLSARLAYATCGRNAMHFQRFISRVCPCAAFWNTFILDEPHLGPMYTNHKYKRIRYVAAGLQIFLEG